MNIFIHLSKKDSYNITIKDHNFNKNHMQSIVMGPGRVEFGLGLENLP